MSIARTDRLPPLLSGLGGLLLGLAALTSPAAAQTAGAAECAATETMRGGKNNFVADAPLVDNLGKGFVVSGTVRKAGSCEGLGNVRVQIWASTERGGEGEASNRGSVMTAADGTYRLETSPIVPNFGQAHIHMSYDDEAFEPVFLRPLLKSREDTSIAVDFNLAPVADDAAGS
ncbi:twin-arginine translocation pathway signal [Aureimonas glaciei]|nr:twin-arginine translocation pathway signal [Aureimonas glaciei]